MTRLLSWWLHFREYEDGRVSFIYKGKVRMFKEVYPAW